MPKVLYLQCNEIYDALTITTWYNWNTSNKKLYLLIQESLQQPRFLRIGIGHRLDRVHLLKVSMYSILS